jgi:hypothetical protein
MVLTKAAAGIAAALLVIGTAGCAATTTGEKSGAHKITYKVTGTKKASITYTDGGTKTSQDTEAKIPWTKTIKSNGDAIVYQLSAQNSTQASKRVKCSISVDGKVVDTNIGKGQFAIASCQYQPK